MMTGLLLAKTYKLSNLIHWSSLFHRIYEEAMSNGKVVPSVMVYPELQRDLHVYCWHWPCNGWPLTVCAFNNSLLMNRNMFVTLSADETGWNSVFTQLIVILDLNQTQLNTVLCDSYHKNLALSDEDLICQLGSGSTPWGALPATVSSRWSHNKTTEAHQQNCYSAMRSEAYYRTEYASTNHTRHSPWVAAGPRGSTRRHECNKLENTENIRHQGTTTVVPYSLLPYPDFVHHSRYSVWRPSKCTNTVTYNCRSVKSSTDSVKQLCRNNDIVILQEHWLLPDDAGSTVTSSTWVALG